MSDRDGRREPCDVDYAHTSHRTLVSAGDGMYWQRCPGIRPEPGERFTPPAIRSLAVKYLRALSADVHGLISRWSVDSSVYDDGPRPRKMEEYPENSLEAWDGLINHLATMEREVRELREWAVRRALEARGARNDWQAILDRREVPPTQS